MYIRACSGEYLYTQAVQLYITMRRGTERGIQASRRGRRRRSDTIVEVPFNLPCGKEFSVFHGGSVCSVRFSSSLSLSLSLSLLHAPHRSGKAASHHTHRMHTSLDDKLSKEFSNAPSHQSISRPRRLHRSSPHAFFFFPENCFAPNRSFVCCKPACAFVVRELSSKNAERAIDAAPKVIEILLSNEQNFPKSPCAAAACTWRGSNIFNKGHLSERLGTSCGSCYKLHSFCSRRINNPPALFKGTHVCYTYPLAYVQRFR